MYVFVCVCMSLHVCVCTINNIHTFVYIHTYFVCVREQNNYVYTNEYVVARVCI